MIIRKKYLITAIVLLLIAVGSSAAYVITRSSKSSPGVEEKEAMQYSSTEVALHDSRSDCWTIIGDEVYDITSYMLRHPGGTEIERACGIDSTSLFSSRKTSSGETVGSGTPHSSVAREQLAKLKIGGLAK